jgi:hypothetical protein
VTNANKDSKPAIAVLHVVLQTKASQRFCSQPQFELDLSVWPPPMLRRRSYLCKKLFYFHTANSHIRISCITFIYNSVLLLNICLCITTLFTYASKNILLIRVTGIIFRVCIGPDEPLQVL